MDHSNLFTDRFNRIQRAVNLEKQDRVPFVLEYAGFAATITHTPMNEFVQSPAKATEVMIQAYEKIGSADGINYGSFFPYGLCGLFGAKVKIPGYDLPLNDMWQVHETELMAQKDYDLILEIGWKTFFDRFLQEKVLNDADVDLLNKGKQPFNAGKKWAKVDLPVLSGGDITTPFDLLCGARSLEKFFMDLITMPDKVEKVMDTIVGTLAQSQCEMAKKKGYTMIWVGGWRTAPCMISPQMWNRFVWPYFKQIVHEVIASGLIAILHLDSNWDRVLKRFKELPERKMIMALDGDTDIFKAKNEIGDHLCIMGDVPATLLAFGSEKDVWDYSRKLVKEIGPEGFILHSGCDIPANAKIENVRVMAKVVLEN